MGDARQSTLLFKPVQPLGNGEYQTIAAKKAGWIDLNFAARTLGRGEHFEHVTHDQESVLVVLGGEGRVNVTHAVQGALILSTPIGGRKDVFVGMPWAVYISRHSRLVIEATTEMIDIAYASCAARTDFPARIIAPSHIAVELRGGGNASRQINSIVPPGFGCERLVCVEVYTPSGNWSSYPPHKHDVHKTDAQGRLVEADLEEIYFYKTDKPAGYAFQHVYTDDRRLDELVMAQNNDVVIIPEGYHPVTAAPGYNVYYLNFLAGSAQSLACSDDPAYAWIKNNWPSLDPRVPVVHLNMNS